MGVIWTPEMRAERSRSIKARYASLSQEEKEERSRKLSSARREWWKGLTAEEREQQRQLHAQSNRNPEVRAKNSAALKHRIATLSPDQKAERSECMRQNAKALWGRLAGSERQEFIARMQAPKRTAFRRDVSREMARQWWASLTQEQIESLREKMRLGHAQAGSAEQCAERNRQRWAAMSPDVKENRIQQQIDNMLQGFRHQFTKIECAVHAVLDSANVKYETQYPIGRCRVDIFIPAVNLIIECDGDYWHGRKDVAQKDMRRDYWLRSKGYHIARLKESDIKTDVRQCTFSVLKHFGIACEAVEVTTK